MGPNFACLNIELLQEEALVDLMQSYHAAPGLSLYSRSECQFGSSLYPKSLQILNENCKVFSQKLKESVCVYELKGDIVIDKFYFI